MQTRRSPKSLVDISPRIKVESEFHGETADGHGSRTRSASERKLSIAESSTQNICTACELVTA